MFASEDEIDLVSVNRLTYMLACLNEGLRMYPPIANGLPRILPAGGARIIDQYIPGKVNPLIPISAALLRQMSHTCTLCY